MNEARRVRGDLRDGEHPFNAINFKLSFITLGYEMNILHGRHDAAFFCASALRIIYIIRGVFRGYVKWFGGQVRGGVAFWRGNVFGFRGVFKQGLAGVDIEQGGGADCGAVGQTAAGAGLVQGLAADAKGGGALGGAGVIGGDGFDKRLHGVGLSVGAARRRVSVGGSGGAVQCRCPICQFVVDAAQEGQLILAMGEARNVPMFVLSVYSRRRRAQVIPVDLMMALVGARLASQGWRRRVNAAFSDYLA